MAASGGLLFGYDLGVTGGVESMASFQKKFFPDVYERTENGHGDESRYCIYNDHILQLFTSSLFLAGLVISLPASFTTRKYGRKFTMVCAGLFFLVGAGLNAGAQDLAMLIIGRVMLGKTLFYFYFFIYLASCSLAAAPTFFWFSFLKYTCVSSNSTPLTSFSCCLYRFWRWLCQCCGPSLPV